MVRNLASITMTDEDNSYDTSHDINIAIHERLKKSRSLRIEDMAGMNSIAVGLSEIAKITVEGTIGDYFGAFNGAATLRLMGDAGNYLGDSMSGGTLRVEGNAGYGTGSYMSGGNLNVAGNTGPATGQRMYDGVITIKGRTGPLTGLGMQGGLIFVAGSCGENTGHNMEDGVIYAKSFKSLGHNAIELPLNKVDKTRLIEYLEIDELEIEDYRKAVAKDDEIASDQDFPVILHDEPAGYMDRIILAPSFKFYTKEDLGDRDDIDLTTKLGSGLGVLKLPIPVIVYDAGVTSPSIISESAALKLPVLSSEIPDEEEDVPQSPYLLRILPERKGVTLESLSRSKGVEIVLGAGAGYYLGGELISSIPERPLDINSSNELKNFIELIREVTQGTKPIIVSLQGENIYDSIFALARGKPDAVILRSALPAAAITAAVEALEDSDRRDSISIYVLGEFSTGEQILKLMALGANGVVIMQPDRGTVLKDEKEVFTLTRLQEELKVLVAYLGHRGISGVTGEDLRTLDYTTAAITGIKLLGYDQKLPIWRH